MQFVMFEAIESSFEEAAAIWIDENQERVQE